MSDQDASQSVESQIETQETPAIPQVDEQQQALSDAMEIFGIEKKKEPESEIEEEDAPPIEQKTEKKGITVKFNKEDTFIEDEKVPDLARKGLNYDKVESRAKEFQTALDEVAQLQGYKDHADLIANLPKLKEQQQQKKQDEETQLRENLRQEAYDAGLDPDKVEAWLDNHPEVKEAKQIKETSAKQSQTQERGQRFNSLYAEFPELAKEIKEDGGAEWYTKEMHDLVENGTPPLVAYKALNMDKIIEQRTKAATQKQIKEQRLGLRSQVETDIKADTEPSVDPELASAFSLFGIPTKNAKKYAKK